MLQNLKRLVVQTKCWVSFDTTELLMIIVQQIHVIYVSTPLEDKNITKIQYLNVFYLTQDLISYL